MKKIICLILSSLLLLSSMGCSGYKPIFGSSNLNFEIVDYSLSGEKKLSQQIYNKLNIASKTDEKSFVNSIFIDINVSKIKQATVKNSAGKVLEYKITLVTQVNIQDLKNNNKILIEDSSFTLSYTVQDQISDTIKYENKTELDLINKTTQNLLIKLKEYFANE